MAPKFAFYNQFLQLCLKTGQTEELCTEEALVSQCLCFSDAADCPKPKLEGTIDWEPICKTHSGNVNEKLIQENDQKSSASGTTASLLLLIVTSLLLQ